MFFRKTLQIDKFEGGDFKSDNSFLKILDEKYPNKAFLVPNLDFLFFCKILQLGKFEGTAFKYDKIIFNFQSNKTNSRISNMTVVFSNYSPKILKLAIFVPKFKDFHFAPNFTIKQIRGR